MVMAVSSAVLASSTLMRFVAERVNVSDSFGGASSRSVTYRNFGPEDVKSYEIGAKTEWFDRRLRVNGVLFDPAWTSVSAWTIQLALSNGANGLTIEGLDVLGNPITNAPVSITVPEASCPRIIGSLTTKGPMIRRRASPGLRVPTGTSAPAPLMAFHGSVSSTCSNPSVSKREMGPAPLSLASSALQNFLRPTPMGLTTPIPVM